MNRLIIYGDFNCPFSALASARADLLLATGRYEIDWRAVQHDPTIPVLGQAVIDGLADELGAEIETVLGLGSDALELGLTVPPVRSNTGSASAALAAAGDDRDQLRRRLFSAVWVEGRNLGVPAELDRLGAVTRDETTSGRWQEEFSALPRPVVPTVVLADGYVSRGLGGLARLAAMAETDGQG